MKKELLITLSLLLALTTGCMERDESTTNSQITADGTMLYVSIEQPTDSRVDFVDSATSITLSWSDDDTFSVYKKGGEWVADYKYNSAAADDQTLFELSSGEALTSGVSYVALYPQRPDTSVATYDDYMALDFTANQTQSGSSLAHFDDACAMLDEFTFGESVKFAHLLAVMTVEFTTPDDAEPNSLTLNVGDDSYTLGFEGMSSNSDGLYRSHLMISEAILATDATHTVEFIVSYGTQVQPQIFSVESSVSYLAGYRYTAPVGSSSSGLLPSGEESLADYEPLKAYIDRVAAPQFKLGAAVDSEVYSYDSWTSPGSSAHYNENFDELVATYHMKHNQVVDASGNYNLVKINRFLTAAEAAGMEVFGHTLCWHESQRYQYLDTLFEVESTGSGEMCDPYEVITDGDCTSDSSCLSTETSPSSGTAPHGYMTEEDGNRCIYIDNRLAEADQAHWRAKFRIKLTDQFLVGDYYTVSLRIKSGSGSTLPKLYLETIGKDFAPYTIATTTEWTTVTFDLDVTSASGYAGATIFGLYCGSVNDIFYFDDISVMKSSPMDAVEDYTDEQKCEIATAALEEWMETVLTATKGRVTAWDVVNEPIDDTTPTELRSDGGIFGNSYFYWQDYMGKDYAREAVRMAREYGGDDLTLFINDYGLMWSHVDKLDALLDWIEYWESDGVTYFDGIASQMHISYYEGTWQAVEEAKLVEMLEKMSATGKLVKLSELDMQYKDESHTLVLAENLTDEQHQKMADYYQFIIEKYFEIVPPAQQYGITHWTPIDPTTSVTWRPGEPVGLWTTDYERKAAYKGYAEGLKSSANNLK